MTEPRFFERPKGLSTREIVALTGAVAHADLPERHISGIAPLDSASPNDLAYMQNAKFADQFAATRAGICLTTEKLAAKAPAHLAVLVTPAPYRAFVAVAQRLYPGAMRPSSLFEASGVSASALVHASARLESGVLVDPTAVIGPRAEIGAGSLIAPGAVIGPDVRIGRDCVIGAGATVVHALIGDRVIIHPGARIGQDGFGYLPGTAGHGKIPQVGRVIIQDGVEIGANATIDRGAIRDTVIGEGTKIDNLVQIAHNVEIGRHCVLAAHTGISGSCTIGDYVMMGGRVGLADNITVGAGAMIGAAAGVMTDVPAGEKWVGVPAMPMKEFFRGVAAVRKLAGQTPDGTKGTGGSEQ
jgi:UDP-3-O-[3-hydroxymyristoyl] glucosamine N-acyltransferase